MLAALVFILSSTSSAQLSLRPDARNNLVLEGRSCELLVRQHRALCSWKRLTDEGFTLTADAESRLERDCKKLSAQRARMVVATCLPAFAKEHHGKKLHEDGPNCWGTAMGFKQLSSKPRFMWSEEMTYWMNTPLCRKLAPGEEKRPGDILNVYGPEYLDAQERAEKDDGTAFIEALFPGRYQAPEQNVSGYTGFHRLLHSETYLTPELAFGKESPNKLDRFNFHLLSETYGRPRDEERECQENQTLAPHLREYQQKPRAIRGSKCAYFTTLHRCENFKTYFNSRNLSGDKELIWKNVQALQGLQEKLFSLVVSPGIKIEECEARLLAGLADVTLHRTREALAQGPVDRDHEMLLAQEYFAAAAIKQSLSFAGLLPK